MGCSISRLDDEEAVKLCRDRKKFIKQAVEFRTKFAMGHFAYIDSLKRVSAALRSYVEDDEPPREYLLDSYTNHTPPPLITANPVKKKKNEGFISFSPDALSDIPIQAKSKSKSKEKTSSLKINYLMSSGNPAVTVVEERPQTSYNLETGYSTMGNNNYGFDGFFTMQTPPPPQSSSSSFPYSPNYDSRPNNNYQPPPSPRNSQWDFFWNPFSSFDYYGYPNRNGHDRPILDDDVAGLRQVREEEGIPDLEEETEHEDSDIDKGKPTSVKFAATEEVTVEDDDDDDDDDEDDDDEDEEDDDEEEEDEFSSATEDEHDLVGRTKPCHGNHEKMEVSKLQKTQEKAIEIPEDKDRHETPGFTVYVNRRPTSMNEVIKHLENQFIVAVTSASKVSAILEPNRSHSLHSNETTVMKMLNPVALIRSSSSRSSSSRFLAYNYKDDESDDQESFSSSTGSHQSTLDRLYAWEKKLYDEVKAGEKVRIAYEKKSNYLKSQDAKGDLTLVEKTRATMRALHTQIKVSFHSVESISKRIEALRDNELQPQLLELVQGLCRMWKAMAECHQLQKRILDEAKVLLAATGGGKQPQIIIMPSSEPYKMARAASNLEVELRNWQATFKLWISSQRLYVQALNSWLHHGRRSGLSSSSPPRPSIDLAPPIFRLCKEWSKFLNVDNRELKVIEGLDFFAAGVGSVYEHHLREDSRNGSSRRLSGGSGNMEMVEAAAVGGGNDDENGMSAEKIMELAMRVLCAGMSVAVSSLTEFAVSSAEGYCDLIRRRDDGSKGSGSTNGS
ncbi:nitrate regulatory gene2 protein-like [Impatiens glandulifera]|uniref:nitrate regulatory gene2 protein-like n=1 Tax=Impatiens glandulifera TaxID=253017 RepID=UPI001FB13AA2|nr:nitrate regulatory gene2 protein-like [Impatiens glandulifera]